MNAELKAKWVAALRSGKFEQGRRALNFYCSIGIALLGSVLIGLCVNYGLRGI